MVVDLYPHQAKALGKIKNGSILRGGVGTGKSLTALAYFFTEVVHGQYATSHGGDYKSPERPRDLYIITAKKKRDEGDWIKDAALFRLATKRENSAGAIQVTVDSWNNIIKYSEVENAFFIFDEQRLVGNGAWVKAFLHIARRNRWILLSATPGDNWMDYIPVLIANGYYKHRTEFIHRHVVFSRFTKFPKVERYVEEGRLNRIRREIIVEMPYTRHTKRHTKYVIVKHDQELFDKAWKSRWNVYEDAPIKDVAELFRVARQIVNTDPSRLGAVLEILEKNPRLIIFYNFNYELDILRTLKDTTNITVAEWNGQKHEPVPTGDSWVYLVQYTAGAEAWNCITTDAELFYSLNYSYKINEQAKGRIDRLNTPYVDLNYYILRSNTPIDQAIMRSLTLKRNFNEKDLVKEL